MGSRDCSVEVVSVPPEDRATERQEALRRYQSVQSVEIVGIEQVELVDGRLLVERSELRRPWPGQPLKPDVAREVIERVGTILTATRDVGVVFEHVNAGCLLLDGQHGVSLRGWTDDIGSTSLPAYPLPERLGRNGTETDPARADVYLMACLFHELVTGRPPSPGVGGLELHVHGGPTRQVLDRALRAEPGQRYPAPDNLVQELRDAEHQEAHRTPPPETTLQEHPPPEPRRTSWLQRGMTKLGTPVAALSAAAMIVAVVLRSAEAPEVLPDQPVGIAVAPDGTVVIAGFNGTVTIISDSGDRDELVSGGRPVDVAVTPDSRTALVSVAGRDSVLVIDLGMKTLSEPIDLGTSPAGLAAGAECALVALPEARAVAPIGCSAGTDRIRTPGSPVDVAVSVDRAYVLTRDPNQVVTIDLRTAEPVGEPADLPLSTAPAQVLAVGDVVAVTDPAARALLRPGSGAAIRVDGAVRSAAVDQGRGVVWVAVQNPDEIVEVDLIRGATGRRIPVTDLEPDLVAVAGDRGLVVADAHEERVDHIEVPTP